MELCSHWCWLPQTWKQTGRHWRSRIFTMKGVAGGNICVRSRGVCVWVSSLSWMKQKPFCFQCCRTLIFPGSTQQGLFVAALEMMTHHDQPPFLAQASLLISACAGQASREPIQSVAPAALVIWLHFRLTCRRVYNWKVWKRMGSASQTPNWEIFAPVHVTGVGPKLGMKETIALFVDVLV